MFIARSQNIGSNFGAEKENLEKWQFWFNDFLQESGPLVELWLVMGAVILPYKWKKKIDKYDFFSLFFFKFYVKNENFK